MVSWYFLPYRLVQLMANLCLHHCLPYAPSGLRSCHLLSNERTRHRFCCSYRCLFDFLQRHDWSKDMCHQPAVQLITYTPIRVQPRKRTLSSWLAEKQPRQTLIGIEWDYSVWQRSDFANVRAADLAESLKREGFLVPTVVLLSRPSGKQVGAQLRYCKEKIMPLQRQRAEISTTELTLEKSRLIKTATHVCSW